MKKVSPDEARQKIRRYCAYQERSHQEVRAKLLTYGLNADDVDRIVVDLIDDDFLNEERFAKAFAGGKFRMKKWGRLKIAHALEAKGVTSNCIKIGLKEIDADDYETSLKEFLETKVREITTENLFARRDKISKSATQKGYEPDLVWKFLKEMLPDQR
jgi:regulatory protein